MQPGFTVLCGCWRLWVVTLWEICCCSAAQGVYDTETSPVGRDSECNEYVSARSRRSRSVHRRDRIRTFLEPFVSDATKTKTVFTLNKESTYDWNDGQWTVPFKFTVGQILRVGKLPISLAVGARYYAEALRAGPDYGLRSLITPTLTTTKTASHPVSNANGKLVD
jgi:hypothetical protein